MLEQPFTNREIDEKFKELNVDLKLYIKETIEPLTKQVTYTNGKLRRIVFILTIIGTATATLLFTNGSELLGFLKLII